MDSYKDGSFEASKMSTVTRFATPRGPIPVTVGTSERFGLGRGGDHIMGIWGGVSSQDRDHIYIYIFLKIFKVFQSS